MARELDPQSEEDLPVGNLIKKLADPEFREKIASADIILGIDVHDEEHQSLFFGRTALESIIRSGRERKMSVFGVGVDFKTNDLEALAAACVVLKGSCCYKGCGDDPGMINPRFN
jgi:hypothetical protein